MQIKALKLYPDGREEVTMIELPAHLTEQEADENDNR